MRKAFCLLLAVLFIIGPSGLFADEELEPIPYEKDEFPQPLKDLRRGEIIFFGSVPITFLLSGLGWQIGQAAAGDSYPFSDNQHTWNILITAGTLSLGIALLDYIIGRLN